MTNSDSKIDAATITRLGRIWDSIDDSTARLAGLRAAYYQALGEDLNATPFYFEGKVVSARNAERLCREATILLSKLEKDTNYLVDRAFSTPQAGEQNDA